MLLVISNKPCRNSRHLHIKQLLQIYAEICGLRFAFHWTCKRHSIANITAKMSRRKIIVSACRHLALDATITSMRCSRLCTSSETQHTFCTSINITWNAICFSYLSSSLWHILQFQFVMMSARSSDTALFLLSSLCNLWQFCLTRSGEESTSGIVWTSFLSSYVLTTLGRGKCDATAAHDLKLEQINT